MFNWILSHQQELIAAVSWTTIVCGSVFVCWYLIRYRGENSGSP